MVGDDDGPNGEGGDGPRYVLRPTPYGGYGGGSSIEFKRAAAVVALFEEALPPLSWLSLRVVPVSGVPVVRWELAAGDAHGAAARLRAVSRFPSLAARSPARGSGLMGSI